MEISRPTTPPPGEGPGQNQDVNLWLLISLIAIGVVFALFILGMFAVRHRRRQKAQTKMQRLLAGMDLSS